MIIELNSVGCGIDFQTKEVYPKFKDGTYDTDNSTPLTECDTEWFEHLSKEDLTIIKTLNPII